MVNLEATSLTEAQTCPAIGYQSASICVPVTVTPFAQAGVTTTKCCGTPVVTPGIAVCGGIKNGSCAFTITQDICVSVPVEFGAVAAVGDSFVSCNTASDQDICTTCGQVPTLTDPVTGAVSAVTGAVTGAAGTVTDGATNLTGAVLPQL